MKKRLLSLLLVLAVVFSFSLSAFATDTGIDIIDDPLSYYFENQMLGVQKGTGVTLVCPKCDYKVVYTGGTLTITIVCMDELSVQMNSRSFKDNINAYFLNTLMCCRHYHISFYGSAQRFQHVDKMLRDVTMNVVQCKKVWRFQFNSYYDGFQLENAQDPTLVRPLRRACWFVTDADYNAYDTLQVVDNLQKSFNENDMLTEAEILANQAAPAPVGMDAVTPSRKAKKIMREKVNR